MHSKVVIDASVFISSFSGKEEFFRASQSLFEEIGKKNLLIVVPMLTIFEILQAHYLRTLSIEEVDQIHEQLIELNLSKTLKILSLEASFLAHFVAYHHEFHLKTSDTVIVLTALKENCPLISWDKQMLKQASKAVEAYTPEEYLKLLAQ